MNTPILDELAKNASGWHFPIVGGAVGTGLALPFAVPLFKKKKTAAGIGVLGLGSLGGAIAGGIIGEKTRPARMNRILKKIEEQDLLDDKASRLQRLMRHKDYDIDAAKMFHRGAMQRVRSGRDAVRRVQDILDDLHAKKVYDKLDPFVVSREKQLIQRTKDLKDMSAEATETAREYLAGKREYFDLQRQLDSLSYDPNIAARLREKLHRL